MFGKKVVTAVHAIRSPHGFSLTYMQDDENRTNQDRPITLCNLKTLQGNLLDNSFI